MSVLERQNKARLDLLVPIRHARMSVSPFTFYRGAAALMAMDLARTPVTGLDVQVCGDAHLLNFGTYASPERTLLFDLNDFDETLPGPWEWDLKRLAASFAVAAGDAGFDDNLAVAAVKSVVRSYRESMATFADMNYLDIWYSRLSVDDVLPRLKGALRKSAEKNTRKARRRTSLQALEKLTETVDGETRIISDPPVLVPLRELPDYGGTWTSDELSRIVLDSLQSYQTTLEDGRSRLLQRFEPVDFALKVVGVGSVGTRCFILYLQGRDGGDPLFLQIKEATRSVLEDWLPASRFRHHGRRVVEGQRLMQAASDIFLGWNTGPKPDQVSFYWRQLRDMKGSVDLTQREPERLSVYGEICGWTLARAHARSGDAIAMSGYLGTTDTFDVALAEFALAYREQNERDYSEFMAAIESGRIPCAEDPAA